MKQFWQILTLALGLAAGVTPAAQAQLLIVAPDGSGSFRTIQEAVNSLPAQATQPRTIFIKKGTYHEKVFVDGKNNLILKGESEKGVTITNAQARDAWYCDPQSNANDWGVATLNMRNSPDVTLENLTIINSYGFEAKGEELK